MFDTTMNTVLDQYITNLLPGTEQLSHERRAILDSLANYIVSKIQAAETLQLLFICTHNSRRSHFSQIWAQVAAHYFGFENVVTYSGGAAVTAFNERAVAALEWAGIAVENPGGDNPHYVLSYADGIQPMVAYSKHYDDESEPP